MTKSINLLDDSVVYGGGAAAALLIEHLIAGGAPRQPIDGPELARTLLERYTAGSATILITLGIWALRRPGATAREAVGLHAALLLLGGGVIAVAYWLRQEAEKGRAATLYRHFGDERNGHSSHALQDHR